MRFDKLKAFELRKQGKSYKEIKAVLGMSLATLSDWFKNEAWSGEIKSHLVSLASTKNSDKLKLMHIARRNQLDRLYDKARQEAREEYQKHRTNPLFVGGLMIYWGEGDKLSKYRCGIANTEPLIIKIFIRFLLEICKIKNEKITVWLLLYPDLKDEICRNFWKGKIGLSESNFAKSITIQGRSSIRRLSYGVCNIAVHNRYFKEKMLAWLQLSAEDLSSENKIAGVV